MKKSVNIEQAYKIWRKEKKNKNNFSDIALTKIADDGNRFEGVVRVPTMSGKCVLVFRKSLERKDTCFITLNVIDESADLENRNVSVRDKDGSILLSGRVTRGKLTGRTHNLDTVDYSFMTVLPEEDMS